MDPPAPVAVVATMDSYGDEEWELCSDDGFVYKRRKRRRVAGDESAASASARPPDPGADAEAGERNQRERMKRILLKLKSRYQSEIQQWEILSNSLSAMQVKADRFQTRQRERLGNAEKTPSFQESSSGGGKDASGRRSLLDERLFMAEAHEAMVSDVSKMCEAAEEMCRAEEEERKEALFDLPIWGSPRYLMSSLCVDDGQ